MALQKLKLDGTENGGTAGEKINLAIDEVDELVTITDAHTQLIATNTEKIALNTTAIEDLDTEQGNHGNRINDLEGASIILNQGATGFDHRIGQETSQGTMEYCLSASSGVLFRIDHNQAFTKLTGQSTFGDGITALADRTFMIRPSTGYPDFEYYFEGDVVTKTTPQVIQHPNTSVNHIISFTEDAVLHLASGSYEAIMDDCICSVVRINATNTEKLIFGNERHGYQMDSATHRMMHETEGTKWATGLEMIGLANNSGVYTELSSGTYYDEDLKHSIASAITSAPFMYREGVGGDWRITSIEDVNIGYQVGGKVQYNKYVSGTDTWSLEPITTNYMIMHFFVTNDKEFPFVKIIGQDLHADRNTAREKLLQEATSLSMGTIPAPEFLHLGSCIIHVEAVGQIEIGTDDEVWVDFRSGMVVPRY